MNNNNNHFYNEKLITKSVVDSLVEPVLSVCFLLQFYNFFLTFNK